MAHRRPLAETISSIYERTGYLAFVSGLAGGEQRVANLVFLHERATQFGTFQRQGLGRFMQFMESLREEADLGQPSVSTEAEDVVRIMSVHRSKGLEFPVVVLPDLGKRINLQDCAGPILVDRQAGLGMVVVDDDRQARYPSLASTLVQERLRRQSMAEELRVLYVAMTRAREHVVLVGTCDESSPEKWKGRWSDHRGPLPSDAIVGAGCILDWLGPVASCHTGIGGDFIRVTCHGSAEVAAWRAPGGARLAESPRLAALAALEPLDPPPPRDGLAEEAISRLTFTYPFQAFAAQPAVRPVVVHTLQPASSTGQAGKPAPQLAPPRFMLENAPPSAADVGSATHLVLEHLDFSRPLNSADLDAQVADLVARRIVDSASAKLADRGGILWLAGTDVGRLLRDNASRLLRELPIYLAAPPDAGSSADNMDQVMVRGRIDVLVPAPGGATVVDFKTDAVSTDAVESRARAYEHQMRQYCDAVARITGVPAARACIVFLTPRVVWEMPGSAPAGAPALRPRPAAAGV
jgi:ATP-dependent helicase/nuclease subunit A